MVRCYKLKDEENYNKNRIGKRMKSIKKKTKRSVRDTSSIY